MALGGGTFTLQNKVLPGAYINFVSVEKASANISDRGYCAIPMALDWGKDKEVFKVNSDSVMNDAFKIFGYIYTDEKLKPIREIFKHATTLYVYRLNSGEKAANDFATANCSGIRGNDIKIVITKNVNDTSAFDVSTLVDTKTVDTQTVKSAKELVANDFVTFKSDAVLAETAATPLEGGTNGDVTADSHLEALKALETVSFNTLGCISNDKDVKSVYAEYTKRMRDQVGAKFQAVIYKSPSDYIGVIDATSIVTDADEQNIVYWLTGAEAGCNVNRTLTNMKYDGEYMIDTSLDQDGLKTAIKNGELVFHKVGDEIHVLTDINSYVSFTKEMNSDFSINQVVRVLDQIGNDIAALFNTTYLGKIQNDKAGRISFWNDLTTYFNKLQDIRAIENSSTEDVEVLPGEGRSLCGSVD